MKNNLEEKRISIRTEWKLNAMLRAITASNTPSETDWGETLRKEGLVEPA